MTDNKETNTSAKTPKPGPTKKAKQLAILRKIFGGLSFTWKRVIIFALIMGVYTALMAMFVPDGNSFHDISVTPEWWVLPAILIIVNCKKPLESALKVFTFFLISQPLVYLIQVPFNDLGWGIFSYYPYWLKLTLLTFPAGFIGWYIKKDKWYSGIILSVMTVLLVWTAIGYIQGFSESFPNHLISIIYCFGIIPIFLFGIFRTWQPRVFTAVITIIAMIVIAVASMGGGQFEIYRYSYNVDSSTDTTQFPFEGKPFVSFWAGDAGGSAEIIEGGEMGYGVKLMGYKNHRYQFSITDESGIEYNFEYFYDEPQQTIILNLLGRTTPPPEESE